MDGSTYGRKEVQKVGGTEVRYKKYRHALYKWKDGNKGGGKEGRNKGRTMGK